MPYTFTITEVKNLVTATSVVYVVTATSENISFAVTTTNVSYAVTQNLNTVTVYENAIELIVDDFSNFFKGDWNSATTYRRGNLVNYAYSLFVCSTGTMTTLTSTVTPADSDSNHWRRVVWHEAPFAYINVNGQADLNSLVVRNTVANLTVTNLTAGSLSVGGASSNGGIATNGPLYVNNTSTFIGTATFAGDINIGGGVGGQGVTFNGTATFNSNVVFNGTSTFNGPVDMSAETLDVGALIINGLHYPVNNGLDGQVLVSRSSQSTATWTNLGELNFWSLSTDLLTNGFDIWSGDSAGTKPNLTIGAGSDSARGARIVFDTNGTKITLTATNTVFSGTNVAFDSARIDVNQSMYINKNIVFYDGSVSSRSELIGPKGDTGDPGARGYTGSSGAYAAIGYTGSAGGIGYTGSSGAYAAIGYTGSQGDVGPQGPLGYSGSLGYTGSAGASFTLNTATSTVLGGVKIGAGIDITGDGQISVNPTYTSSLQGHLNTNGYRVQLDGSNTVTNLTLASARATLQSDANAYVDISDSTTQLYSELDNPESEAYGYNRGLHITKLVLDNNPPEYTDYSNASYGRNTVSLSAYSYSEANQPSLANLSLNRREGSRLEYWQNGSTSTRLVVGGIPNVWNATPSNWTMETSLESFPWSAGANPKSAVPINIRRWNGLTTSSSITEYIRLDDLGIKLSSTATVTITGTNVVIGGDTLKVGGTGGVLVVGPDEEHSTIRVSRLYNYAGTSAPFFPAGVQYPDNGIQIVAYTPDLGILPGG